MKYQEGITSLMKLCISLGGFENFIYGFDHNSQSYIVRISHSSHRIIEEIKSEQDFACYLAENGAKVSKPIKTIHNSLVEEINASDGSYFIFSAYTKAPGRAPKPSDASDDFFFEYGKTVGRFHFLTKKYTPSKGIKRRFHWYQDDIIDNAKKLCNHFGENFSNMTISSNSKRQQPNGRHNCALYNDSSLAILFQKILELINLDNPRPYPHE